MDDLDRYILELQQKDIFFSHSDLAASWGVTTDTIGNRIKRLRKLGVMDVIQVLNPYKIGYKTFAIIAVRLEADADADEIANTLLTIAGVINVVLVVGRYDLIIEYVCQNIEVYRRFVISQLRKTPGILSTESFLGLDLYERRFQLGVKRKNIGRDGSGEGNKNIATSWNQPPSFMVSWGEKRTADPDS